MRHVRDIRIVVTFSRISPLARSIDRSAESARRLRSRRNKTTKRFTKSARDDSPLRSARVARPFGCTLYGHAVFIGRCETLFRARREEKKKPAVLIARNRIFKAHRGGPCFAG